jgi:hypothetical protein
MLHTHNAATRTESAAISTTARRCFSQASRRTNGPILPANLRCVSSAQASDGANASDPIARSVTTLMAYLAGWIYPEHNSTVGLGLLSLEKGRGDNSNMG